MTINAFEVKDGLDAIFCETLEDAQMVAREWERRAKVINVAVKITIEPVVIIGFLETEQAYIERLRKSEANNE